MKNGEKYKTAKARERAFDKFCSDIYKNNGCCNDCPADILASKKKIKRCLLAWLDMKAEEDTND